MDAATLMQTADRLLDGNEFDNARSAYREALSQDPSPSKAYANLAIAETAEAISFLRTLVLQYPDSGAAQLALAHAYLRSRRYDQALNACNAAMTLTDGSVQTRILRYRSALGAHAFDLAREDFLFVWKLGRERKGARSIRKTLLREILGIDEPRVVTFMNEVRASLPSEAELHSFFLAKETELQTFSAIVSTLGAGATGGEPGEP